MELTAAMKQAAKTIGKVRVYAEDGQVIWGRQLPDGTQEL